MCGREQGVRGASDLMCLAKCICRSTDAEKKFPFLISMRHNRRQQTKDLTCKQLALLNTCYIGMQYYIMMKL